MKRQQPATTGTQTTRATKPTTDDSPQPRTDGVSSQRPRAAAAGNHPRSLIRNTTYSNTPSPQRHRAGSRTSRTPPASSTTTHPDASSGVGRQGRHRKTKHHPRDIQQHASTHQTARSSSTRSRTPDHHTCASERPSTSIQPNTPTEDPTPERAQRDAANGIQQTTVERPSNSAPSPRIQRNIRTPAAPRLRNASSSRTRTVEYAPTTNRPKTRTDTHVGQARRADHRHVPRIHASPGESIEKYYATPAGIERRRAPADHTD